MDTKALFTQRFDAARTALAAGNEPAAAESLHWAIVAARSDSSLRRELASALFHLGKLSRKLGRAGEAEAGPLLTEALTISEELFGAEHSALGPMLNELSRLYLQQSQHTRAEQALERLLAIARLKGDEHPDVAAALAALAFVKRKVGDDVSAEAFYRDALRIREKVLEPDHTVTIGTLEQLSETCAARGNFDEALALLKRAIPAREAALGAGHERVRAARSRVSELELQIAIAADTAAEAAARVARNPTPTPVWLKRVPESPADMPSSAAPSPTHSPSHLPSPTHSKNLEFIGDADALVLRPTSRTRDRSKTPAVAAVAVAAASLMAASIPTPAASQVAIAQQETAVPSASVASRESGAIHRDIHLEEVVLAVVGQAEVARPEVVYDDRRSEVALSPGRAPEPPRKKRTMLYASAGIGAVAVAMAGMLMLRPRTNSGTDPVVPQAIAAQPAAASIVVATATPAVTAAATSAAAVASTTRADSFHAVSQTTAHAAATATPAQHAPETAQPELVAPRVDIHVDPVNTSKMPAAVSFDSAVRASNDRQRAADSERVRIGDVIARPAPADVDVARIPPKLIGRVPEPHFPDALIRAGTREGQVTVRFMVNENGTVETSSMIVEQSDNDLFTDAVRDILPQFRFQPGRTRADLKAVSAWVSVPFRFTTKKKS